MLKNKGNIDYLLASTIFILVLFGILILFSTSAPLSERRFGDPYHFFRHQLLFGLIPGLVLGFFAFVIPLSFFRKWAPLLFLINLVLTAMVFLPHIGIASGGSRRWLNFGFFSIQPSEFLKITFVFYLAAWLSNKNNSQQLKGGFKFKRGVKRKNIPKGGQSRPFLGFLILISLVAVLLVFQPDISTMLIILSTAIGIYFLSGASIWQMVLMFFIGLISLFPLIKIAPYRMARILVFLKPNTDILGMGYHLNQALIALGSGGLFGLGMGMSHQKFGFLPQTMTDSIFAVFSEEAGFVGGCILVLLFLFFLWRGFSIALRSQDKFCQLISFGITFWITFQAFFNIGSISGILPLAGIPLPFISYGGSGLISALIGAGVLLNASRS